MANMTREALIKTIIEKELNHNPGGILIQGSRVKNT